MTDPVNLLLPADARFRGLAPEVGGRYVVAAGGSETDAAAVAEALKTAIDTLTTGAADDAGVELKLRGPDGPDGATAGAIEVTVQCAGKSTVVTHPVPAAKT